MKCLHPIVVKNKLVPCGNCVMCNKRRINDWAVRMQLEARCYNPQDICFVTLTYNDDNIPQGGILSKRDLQLFLKRLRRRLDRKNIKIKYYSCGEYGSKFHRPHYHLVIFGIGLAYTSIINDCWKLGFTLVKSIRPSHFHYVAKYCVKAYAKEVFNMSSGEFIPEFTTMSRRKPIGYCSVDSWEKCVKLFSDGFITLNGFKFAIPKSLKQFAERNFGLKVIPSRLYIYYNEKLINNFSLYGSHSDYINFLLKNDTNLSYILKHFPDVTIQACPFSYISNAIDLSKKLALEFCMKKFLPENFVTKHFVFQQDARQQLYNHFSFVYQLF